VTLVNEALGNAYKHVKKFHLNKKKGGYRVISQPSSKLKVLQYWVITNISEKLPVDGAAFAYQDGISILHNADFHKGNKYFLKVDLKDFFPSITFNDFIRIVRIWHKIDTPQWKLNRSAESFIKKCCFDENGRLDVQRAAAQSTLSCR
jgi:RNA-directed DNA polymerase